MINRKGNTHRSGDVTGMFNNNKRQRVDLVDIFVDKLKEMQDTGCDTTNILTFLAILGNRSQISSLSINKNLLRSTIQRYCPELVERFSGDDALCQLINDFDPDKLERIFNQVGESLDNYQIWSINNELSCYCLGHHSDTFAKELLFWQACKDIDHTYNISYSIAVQLMSLQKLDIYGKFNASLLQFINLEHILFVEGAMFSDANNFFKFPEFFYFF